MDQAQTGNPAKQKVPAAKNKSSGSTKTSGNASTNKSAEAIKETSVPTVQSQNLSSGVNEGAAMDVSYADTTASVPVGDKADSVPLEGGKTDTTGTESKKIRVVVPKPSWIPHEEAVAALQLFKMEVDKFGPSSLKKGSPFPNFLESVLLELVATVSKFHEPKELNKTVGFYESISSCLGTHFPAGRVKSIIARLQARRHCRGLETQLHELLEKFKEDLKSAIIVCPADKKIQRKEQKGKDKKNATVGDDEMDVVEPSPSPIATEAPVEISAVEINSQQHSIPTVAVPVEEIIYVWYCKWTLSLRQRLVELLDFCSIWTKAENEYRNKLILADKKEMSPNEYVELQPEAEIENIIDNICSIFPSDCLGGDKAAIRQAIKTERARLKRGISATATNKVASTATNTSSVAVNAPVAKVFPTEK